MTQIIYPDSEEVNYHYQLGQLTQVGDYASQMTYDEYDKLTYMQYGNQIKTSYSYDANRHWLTQQNLTGTNLTSQNRYSYDKVGNILGISQTATLGSSQEQKAHSYKYDMANRLIESHGTTTVANLLPNTNYDYEIGYSLSGMITSKTTMLNEVENVLKYVYGVNSPAPMGRGQGGGEYSSTDVRNHQIRTISSGTDTTRLTWDADGQLSQMSRVDSLGEVRGSRMHLWNENGQMAMFLSDDQAGYYGYDGNGERVYKLTGYVYDYDYNAGQDSTRVYFNDAVLYVNPYFIVTPKGYTKHYYNGSQRLASVVGDLNNLPDSIAKDGDKGKTAEYAKNFSTGDTLVNLQVDYETNMLKPVLNKEKPSQENYVLADNTYYYHGDHLGSMSWVTDGFGDIIEHRTYLPYGEEWYHYKTSEKYTERFTFTGKEKDEESGYYYYGARYYDPTLLTSWMSVDPLAGKYPYMNPYAYCEGNPIKNIDPDGRKIVIGSFLGRVAARLGINNFEKKTQNYLNSLKNTNSELRQSIEGMENNQNLDVKIKPSVEHKKQTNGVTTHKDPGEIEQGSTIYYDTDHSREVEGVEMSPEGILAHELGHADNLIKGEGVTYDKDKAMGRNQPQDEGERQKGNQSEEKSIRFENYVRAKEGKPQRSYEYYKKKNE